MSTRPNHPPYTGSLAGVGEQLDRLFEQLEINTDRITETDYERIERIAAEEDAATDGRESE